MNGNKLDSKPIKRLVLHRETVRSLSVRSHLRTGADTTSTALSAPASKPASVAGSVAGVSVIKGNPPSNVIQ